MGLSGNKSMPLIVHLVLGNLILWSGFSLCKEGTTMPCYLTRVLCEFADTHKAPWKWRGLHKSLVLFTQQTFPPETKVINGTIVQPVERVQKFPFTTSRSSCGWLYGLSVLMPSCLRNSGTMVDPGMKSCTVQDGRIVASHHIGQSCVVTSCAPFLTAERNNSRHSGHRDIERGSYWEATIFFHHIDKLPKPVGAHNWGPEGGDYNYSSSFFFSFWILGPGTAGVLNQRVFRSRM